jgi:hypothetical protein
MNKIIVASIFFVNDMKGSMFFLYNDHVLPSAKVGALPFFWEVGCIE